MPSTFTYPGVYVTEKPSGAQAVPAAATSVALFVGMADIGPFDTPTRVQSLANYVRTFGETSAGEMADQVRQFFLNGGGDCYVMRIADGEVQSQITVRNEAGTSVLRILARDAGRAGDLIRVEVDYATATPELTFNLTAYRSVSNPDGTFGRTAAESHVGLSMDPNHPRYVVTAVAGASNLIRVEDLGVAPLVAGGVSMSGWFLRSTPVSDARTNVAGFLDGTHKSFNVSVAGRPPVTAVVDTNGLTEANVLTRIRDAIVNAYQAQLVNLTGTVTVTVDQATPAALGRLLEIRSTEGAVLVSSAPTNDCAAALMLGSANGGLEFDAFTPLRPAPTGVFARLGTAAGAPTSGWLGRVFALAHTDRDQLTNVSLADPGSTAAPFAGPVAIAGTAGDPIGHAASPPLNVLGSLELVRAGLDAIAQAITVAVAPGAGSRWSARREGLRLVLRPSAELGPATPLGVGLTTTATDLGAAGAYLDRTTQANLAAYTVGVNAGGSYQTASVAGSDGNKPGLSDYLDAFSVVASSVEIFNMMVLPRAVGQTDADRKSVWGAGSSFCAQQRAILFVDPPSTWTDIDKADSGASALKVGVNTRNSVAYWPRVTIPSALSPQGITVDPSGSMAGVYARTDTRFGTWTAPAGLEATLTSVLGLEVPMSDADNGRINPKALNAIRLFPSGVTSWGARTMVGADDTGNVDDKYVNVRRMMLFIENSLYRGLRFAVFRSNAEPLWASIRLAAGGFMDGLMRQGAFASTTKSKAYYVLCDGTTTTPEDVNLGIVNVLVGFAPNKPAEFVHLVVTQLAGQVQE